MEGREVYIRIFMKYGVPSDNRNMHVETIYNYEKSYRLCLKQLQYSKFIRYVSTPF